MRETSRSAAIRNEEAKYDDIIHLPRHVSASHPPMSLHDRAAQFSPFAALTGHAGAVRETARHTQERMELSEDERAELDEKIRMIQECMDAHPEISVTYFQPDQRKKGGAYVEAVGSIKKIDGYEQVIVMEGGKRIPMGQVAGLDGDLFRFMEAPCE